MENVVNAVELTEEKEDIYIEEITKESVKQILKKIAEDYIARCNFNQLAHECIRRSKMKTAQHGGLWNPHYSFYHLISDFLNYNLGEEDGETVMYFCTEKGHFGIRYKKTFKNLFLLWKEVLRENPPK